MSWWKCFRLDIVAYEASMAIGGLGDHFAAAISVCQVGFSDLMWLK